MNLNFEKCGGLLPAVVQEAESGEVLMVGFMNAEALEATRQSGEVTFYSRSRQRLWRKGERSGHRLIVREVRVDCDADTLLVRAEMTGPGVCHEGFQSCFYRRLEADGTLRVTGTQTFSPGTVYAERSQP